MASVGQELLNVPFPAMVLKLASAIAEGQYQLDQVSMEIAKLMSKTQVQIPDITNDDAGAYVEVSMLSAGFQPTFYQFTDTIIEVRMAITMERTIDYTKTTKGTRKTYSKRGNWFYSNTRVTSTPVDAKYSSTYSYHVEGSSLLRTKITPVPPNQFMQRILDMKAEAIRMQFELQIAEAELALGKKRDEIDKQLTAANEKNKDA